MPTKEVGWTRGYDEAAVGVLLSDDPDEVLPDDESLLLDEVDEPVEPLEVLDPLDDEPDPSLELLVDPDPLLEAPL